jgi:phosphoribosylaminoimidazole carboxylase (NCAIR synthetase)
MDLFKKAFTTVLEQDEQTPAKPATDKEAMQAKLDSAKPEDFDVQAPVITDTEKIKQEQLTSLKSWIGQIDQFIEFLNGTDSSSIQSQLHAAACETVFQDIARSEKKKIARLAAELSSLSESFKGYLISSGTD